jgi:hypothetical protein
VSRLLPVLQSDIRYWPEVAAHYARLLERPPVRAALEAEASRPWAALDVQVENEAPYPSTAIARARSCCNYAESRIFRFA